MKRIYSVIINGRTLEGWDLKELLARAVSAKRSSNCRFRLQDRSCERIPAKNPTGSRMAVESAIGQ